MKIIEEDNDLYVLKQQMICDKIITNNKGDTVAYPLMKTSFLYLICGPSGSGKTNLLMSLLKSTKKTKNGECFSYRKMFDNIVYVSPSSHTIQNNPLDNLPDDQKFKHLTEDVFEKVDELTEDAIEEDNHTLLILDDVSSELRKSKPLTTQLNMLSKNRRHKNLSIIIIGHKLIDYDPALRNNSSLIILFKPKNNKEMELVRTEFLNKSLNDMRDIMDYVYKTRHDFMIIDQSLRKSGNFEIFRNFNKLTIMDE
jgi:GTPase SAR1 family protein